MEKQPLKLIPPSDPRVVSAIAPFNDEMLKEHGYKDRQELSDDLFETMNKYGGIGLSANQVGLPYNVFVISHKGDTLLDKFPSVLKFEKYKNFTRMA